MPRTSTSLWKFFPAWLLFACVPALASGSTNQAATVHPHDRGPGITYMRDIVEEVPWSIHVVKVDRSRADLRFETTLGSGKQIGMGVVSDQIKTLPAGIGRAVAAINGDFFENKSGHKYPGDPNGIQIIQGEVVSSPITSHSCFWIDSNGQPHIGIVQSNFTVTLPNGQTAPFGLNQEREKDGVVLYTAAIGASTRTSGGTEIILGRGTNDHWLPLRVGETYSAVVKEIRTTGDAPIDSDTIVLSVGPKISSQVAGLKTGDTIALSTATTPNLAGSQVAIGGGPALVHGHVPNAKFGGLQTRQPRTALGWNKDYFFLVEADGRQKISAGMTFSELAAYMVTKLGCDEAINLDGGGSATLWVFGQVMNNPSEGHERPAANALVVVRKPRPD